MREEIKYLIMVGIAIIVVLIYHIIVNIGEGSDDIIFYGVPGGPKPPNGKKLANDKKITGLAYIYDSGVNDYRILRNENGEKLILDEIIFSDNEIVDIINKYRQRAGQYTISKDELIGIAKSLGYKTDKAIYSQNKYGTGLNLHNKPYFDSDFVKLYGENMLSEMMV